MLKLVEDNNEYFEKTEINQFATNFKYIVPDYLQENDIKNAIKIVNKLIKIVRRLLFSQGTAASLENATTEVT